MTTSLSSSSLPTSTSSPAFRTSRSPQLPYHPFGAAEIVAIGPYPGQPIDEHVPVFGRILAIRLLDGFPEDDFGARTGLPLATIRPALDAAFARGWLESRDGRIRASALGQRFLNDVIASFLP